MREISTGASPWLVVAFISACAGALAGRRAGGLADLGHRAKDEPRACQLIVVCFIGRRCRG